MTVQTVEQAIYNILHAVYGEEVRDSLAEGLRMMNNKSQADKEDAEAYAKGTRNGVAVTSSDPAYHNNSKYYSQQASSSATTATSAKDSALSAQTAAEDARDIAVNAKNTAVSAKDDAVGAKTAAESARDTAVSAKVTAVSAKDTAVSAKDTAVSAQNTAVSASQSASTSASQAASSASSAASSASTATSASTTATSAMETAVAAKNEAVLARTDILGVASMIEYHDISVPVSAWTASSTYSGYNYQASLSCEYTTTYHIPEVIFYPDQADSGNFAPIAATIADGVVVYARTIPNAAITIPTIICKRLVN